MTPIACGNSEYQLDLLVQIWRTIHASNGGNLHASMRRIVVEIDALRKEETALRAQPAALPGEARNPSPEGQLAGASASAVDGRSVHAETTPPYSGVSPGANVSGDTHAQGVTAGETATIGVSTAASALEAAERRARDMHRRAQKAEGFRERYGERLKAVWRRRMMWHRRAHLAELRVVELEASEARMAQAAVEAAIPLEAIRAAGTEVLHAAEVQDGIENGIRAVREAVTLRALAAQGGRDG